MATAIIQAGTDDVLDLGGSGGIDEGWIWDTVWNEDGRTRYGFHVGSKEKEVKYDT